MTSTMTRFGMLTVAVLGIIVLGAYTPPHADKDTSGSTGLSVSGTHSPSTYTSLSQKGGGEVGNVKNETHEAVSLSEFLKATETAEDVLGDTETIDSSAGEELRAYGNAAGKVVRQHGAQFADESTILTNYVANPDDDGAREGLASLAEAYRALKNTLEGIAAPSALQTAHRDFTSAHQRIADSIEGLLGEVTEETLISYNDSVEPYLDAYLRIAQTLRAHDVSFSESEPGSIFTLPF